MKSILSMRAHSHRGSELMQVITLSVAGAWWINLSEGFVAGAVVQAPIVLASLGVLGGVASWLDYTVAVDDDFGESIGWHEEDGFMARGGFALTGWVIWFCFMIVATMALASNWAFNPNAPWAFQESLITASGLTWFGVLGLTYCLIRAIALGVLWVFNRLAGHGRALTAAH